MFGLHQEEREEVVALPEVWPSANIYVIKIPGKNIALSKFGDTYYAYSNTCPHAGATLSDDNVIVKDCLICPLHQYKFNVKNGLNVSGEGYKLKTYRVEPIDNQHIKIHL